LLLGVLGAKHVESPYIEIGQLSTFFYFIYFLFLLPSFSYIENTLVHVRTIFIRSIESRRQRINK
jgi:ubiquinol-cytochrome c reductase cytochrome b subunit